MSFEMDPEGWQRHAPRLVDLTEDGHLDPVAGRRPIVGHLGPQRKRPLGGKSHNNRTRHEVGRNRPGYVTVNAVSVDF